MACHFSYRTQYALDFTVGNYPTANTDGSAFNELNNPNNDWFTVVKKITVEAAIKGISNIALFFYLDGGEKDSGVDYEEYTIGSSVDPYAGTSVLGYNFSTNKFTVTKFMDYDNPVFSFNLTDYTFDSGAGSVNDFYTHLVRDLYEHYMDTAENRAAMQFLVSSMGGPKITPSGERGYFGSAIPINRLHEINYEDLAKIMSCVHPFHGSVYAIMTLCTSSDSDAGMCALKKIKLNDQEQIDINYTTYPGPGYAGISSSGGKTVASYTVDLANIASELTEKARVRRWKLNWWI